MAYPSGRMITVRSDICDSTSTGVTIPSWRRIRECWGVWVFEYLSVEISPNWLYCFFSSRDMIGLVSQIASTRWIGSMYLFVSVMIIVIWYGARSGVIVTTLITDLIRANASLSVSIGDVLCISVMSPCSIRLPYGIVTTAPIGISVISPDS